jgi:hypothetical protein
MESNERNEARTAARLRQLRHRIEGWRQRRTKRSPMPAELWTAATELARELGAYRVARELGVGYGSLKERLGGGGERSGRAGGGFVEIAGPALLGGAPTTVELSDTRGRKVAIRLGAGQAVDVAALVAAWRTAGR